jgi:hypothetical protein
MQTFQSEEKIPHLNFYKILFNKHDTLPVGHYSRNLATKIKDTTNNLLTLKEKNMEHFNPISENNIFKIQRLYSKFKRNKSANKFYNSTSRKIMNKLLSRPMSQYSTIIDLSKNAYNIKLKKNSPFRAYSNNKEETTRMIDQFWSNNISKIERNKIKNLKRNKIKNDIKNFYIKKDINKKNKEQRSSSAQFFYQKKELIKQQNIKSLIKHEEEMKQKKKLLKGRLLTALSRHLVINNQTFKLYEVIYKNEENKGQNESQNIKNKVPINKYFHFTNPNSYCFSNIRPPFRYEDYYYSPMELIKKYFTKEEIIVLKSSPGYFGLNKFPFKNSDFEFNPTLLSKFSVEDDKETIDDDHIKKYQKQKSKFDLDKEMKKIKNIFKEKKIIKKKREPIKGKDFVSHYERDIDPDEGTVAYFDRKYLKYLMNKEKKMEKKINNLKYKKSRFEYLKNLRTQKLQEEKNIQRITSPVINIIKRNYLRSNSNLNI